MPHVCSSCLPPVFWLEVSRQHYAWTTRMLEFLNGYSAHVMYVLLFVLLLLCGLGFPMAEELVLLAGGVLVASRVLNPLLMLLVNLLGVVIGDMFLFGMGRGVRSHRTRSPRFTAWFAQKLERGRPFFARH